MEKDLKIYCVTNKVIPYLEDSKLLLAGVGKEKFNEKYIKSSIKQNIFYKEKHYSELTFHYWYWKNLLLSEQNQWVGFCQKRRFWINKNSINKKLDNNNINEHLLIDIDKSWENSNAILCEPINISGAKKIKLIKRGWRNILNEPGLLFKKKRKY